MRHKGSQTNMRLIVTNLLLSRQRLSLAPLAGFCLGLFLIFVASGCSLAGGRAPQEAAPAFATAATDAAGIARNLTDTPAPISTRTLSATATPTPTKTPAPSSTYTPSATASATATLTPTPTPHPMSILAAREKAYPGSPITVVETLEPGVNYYRYLASYESDGLKIYGLLTKPYGERPANGWPALVFNHGYIPPQVYRTTQRYIAYVDRLARRGYIVFKIDYRGNDQSEGEPTGAYGDPGYTDDVLNAVSALQAFPDADAQRIGMWGHSMGGFLTLRAMVISRQIKAAVIWSGVVASYPDLMCCWHQPTPGVPTHTPDPNYRPGWRAQWQDLYGSPEVNPEFWQGISANSYLNDLSGPIQLDVGTGDTEVPIKFSQDLYQQILSAGQTAEYYEYPGDDHNLSHYFTQAMTHTLAFFDKYLKGEK